MKKRLLGLIICVILAVLALAGCDEAVKHDIVFMVDGTEHASISTAGEETLTMPNDPTKDGYIFDGWFLDLGVWKKSFTKDSFIDALLTGDVEVYAKFTECTHIGTKNGEVCGTCGKVFSCIHADADEDGECDICEEKLNDTEPEVIKYPWSDGEPVQIIIQLTNASHAMTLTSGCQRYLAGEDPDAIDKIDTLIAERNDAAQKATNIAPIYRYYEDDFEHSMYESVDAMYAEIFSDSNEAADIYCNFTFDLLGSSLLGVFANLKSHNNNYAGINYFEFLEDDWASKYDSDGYSVGYMYEYMMSTTLNEEKAYILASDYFIDLVRAFYVVPVNINLLEANGQDITGDLDGDGKFTVKDFYKEVKDGKWTYSKVIEYGAKVYEDTDKDGDKNFGDTLGFALSLGVAPGGILYSSQLKVIEWDDNLRGYVYPEEPTQLFEAFDKISELVNSDGIAFISSNNMGLSPKLAIREAFSANKVLFGNVVLLGDLEDANYQKLMREKGFGVVPVPLRTESADGSKATYHTSIYNAGRSGAISSKTEKFAECTAFLNYQSQYRGTSGIDSSDVLIEYYRELMYGKNVDVESAVDMLRFIRSNIGSDFDKIMDDINSMRFNHADAYHANFTVESSNLWQNILAFNRFDVDLRYDYKQYAEEKYNYLLPLIIRYNSSLLPS